MNDVQLSELTEQWSQRPVEVKETLCTGSHSAQTG
jgi:hypothetical protein